MAETGNIPKNNTPIILPLTMEYIPALTLVPRFILTIRELHACSLQRWRRTDIDTGFGLTSASHHGPVAIIFGDSEYDGPEHDGEVPMEELEISSGG